ncbi:MAG: hypothetical protein JW829_10465 [Pirellulales bacterium]|nr:hypothetical protein [Pirellulales bacterium]
MHTLIRTIHTVDPKSLDNGHKTLLALIGRDVRALVLMWLRYLAVEPNESAPVVPNRWVRSVGISVYQSAIVRWPCRLLLGLRGMRWGRLAGDAIRFGTAGIAIAVPALGSG